MNLETVLLERLRKSSGFDERRPYVGMSKAGDCPTRIYREYVNGTPATDDSHVGAWLGYTMERAVLNLLDGEVKRVPELTAFGGMVRGHVEGELWGDLLEVKSVTNEKLTRILNTNRIPPKNYFQAQAYMQYGGWRMTRIVYVPRDFGTPIVWSVPYDRRDAEAIDAKFFRVVTAIKASREPHCECGRCPAPASPAHQEVSRVL